MSNGATTVERIRLEIEAAIQNGEFVAGERLTETALTHKLKVSRGPLREALLLLENDGIVERQNNKGAVVRKLSRQQLSEFFQMREMFERFAAASCAKRINEAGVRDSFVALYQEAEHLQNGQQARPFSEHDEELHTTILSLANNDTLVRYWRRLRMPLMRLRFITNTTVFDVARSATEHMNILGGILDGDERGAADAIGAHVGRINGIVQRMDQGEFERVFWFAKDITDLPQSIEKAAPQMLQGKLH
ncbi:GntR family transcriptional regulator [Thalassovita taeanensis]|uniref:DNA-binding transcriptional regulator, GntR family n=1 Tax=Thalassovita taeanensis TaxID=657014 RepID=A0A1H9IYM1_9RHOB|nr:GntR family transcriptional regulator [Thalassovita taeanensis]SEQ79619.1 DNA-binding transcriptional regulator, GntR family [Thalassovita taeanensis]